MKSYARLKGLGLLLLVLLMLVLWVYLWETRRGCFSYTNYQRIDIGMTLGQVHSLLGTTGEVIEVKYVPFQKRSDGIARVVQGESYWKWGNPNGYIYLGVTDGRVTGKYYSEPSL
jgi:hypothetical protein